MEPIKQCRKRRSKLMLVKLIISNSFLKIKNPAVLIDEVRKCEALKSDTQAERFELAPGFTTTSDT